MRRTCLDQLEVADWGFNGDATLVSLLWPVRAAAMTAQGQPQAAGAELIRACFGLAFPGAKGCSRFVLVRVFCTARGLSV